MSAGVHNFTIEKGSTFDPAIQLSTGGFVADGGTAINLTGFSAQMYIRRNVRAEDTLLELTTTNGRIDLFDPTDGWLRLLLTDEETAALTFKSGVYDLEIESAGGERKRRLQGKITVSPEVTYD